MNLSFYVSTGFRKCTLFYEGVTHRLGAFPHVKYSSVSTYTVFMYAVAKLERVPRDPLNLYVFEKKNLGTQ